MPLIDLIRAAGPGSRLVARPAGVAHVYAGPLTPSGRYVPTSARTVCRAHHRRLTVLPERWSSLAPAGSVYRRLCTPCRTRLVSRARRAPALVTHDDVVDAYRGTTVPELAACVVDAATTEETHRIGRVASALYGPPRVRFTQSRMSPIEHALCDLHDAIHHARRLLASAERSPEDQARIYAERDSRSRALIDSIARRKKQAWQEREDRIARIGITNATRR